MLALSPLTAISPLDGRYERAAGALRAVFSEFAFMRARVRVEIEWLIALGTLGMPELPAFDAPTSAALRVLASDFSLADCTQIKEIEARINHDVKAVEYWIREHGAQLPAVQRCGEFIHFGCTSEDINNVAYALMLREGRELLLANLRAVHARLRALAHAHAATAMLSRTHGQPATPTTVGKEFANFAQRLAKAVEAIGRVPIRAKMNGAVGNFNAHLIAAPQADWEAFARGVVEGLGLQFNAYTIQIEPHDWMAELFDAIARANTVVLDLDRDVWGYIALGYFRQRLREGEVGSSTMPHKVNPIDFENSEGNLGIANALLRHFAEKLPVSRWQRDLSDSTVLRNLGVAFGYCQVSYQACLRGLNKIEVDSAALAADLEDSWEVLAEAVQTVMRRYGVAEPYEKLKALTRGQRIDRDRLHEFVRNLPIPESARQALLELTPATYLGKAAELARRC
ncbi:MAG TPA: adenylosuccinate lyase [Burkholderiaceae bacterium]|nr:adenylosuccinate lyase [Burkholderiaceae bacterium]